MGRDGKGRDGMGWEGKGKITHLERMDGRTERKTHEGLDGCAVSRVGCY